MMSTKDFAQVKFLRAKNLLTEQNFDDISSKINAPTFSATLGLGIATATSSVVLVHGGGFTGQRMTAVMRYVSPTVQGTENIGIMLRVQNIETTADATYYMIRVQAGVARITRVVDNVFTTLDSSPFVLPVDTDVTIVGSIIGSALSATFTVAGGTPAPVTIGAIDPNIANGIMGFRGTSQTMYCKSFTAEQL